MRNETVVKSVKIKEWIKKHWYVFLVLYYPVCMVIYTAINRYRTPVFNVHSVLDDMIPFSEYFVVPYAIWYVYLFATFLYFMVKSKNEFLKFCIFTYAGMTLAYTFYFFFPNAISFRPDLALLGRDNIFIVVLDYIYKADVNPHNVFPSLHCYNALVISVAICKSKLFDGKNAIKIGSWILTFLICYSTAAVKQHSILDFFGAVVLLIIVYPIAYKVKWKFKE